MPTIEIHVRGNIDPEMTDWFQGVTIRSISADETCLQGVAADNSAICGILSAICNLGLALISVSVTQSDETDLFPTGPP